jgi:hypothetical protein
MNLKELYRDQLFFISWIIQFVRLLGCHGDLYAF